MPVARVLTRNAGTVSEAPVRHFAVESSTNERRDHLNAEPLCAQVCFHGVGDNHFEAFAR